MFQNRVWDFIALDPSVDPDTLRWLYQRSVTTGRDEVQMQVVANPACPVDLLVTAAGGPVPRVRGHAIGHPALPVDEAVTLVTKETDPEAVAVASWSTKRPEVLRAIVNGPLGTDDQVVVALASIWLLPIDLAGPLGVRMTRIAVKDQSSQGWLTTWMSRHPSSHQQIITDAGDILSYDTTRTLLTVTLPESWMLDAAGFRTLIDRAVNGPADVRGRTLSALTKNPVAVALVGDELREAISQTDRPDLAVTVDPIELALIDQLHHGDAATVGAALETLGDRSAPVANHGAPENLIAHLLSLPDVTPEILLPVITRFSIEGEYVPGVIHEWLSRQPPGPHRDAALLFCWATLPGNPTPDVPLDPASALDVLEHLPWLGENDYEMVYRTVAVRTRAVDLLIDRVDWSSLAKWRPDSVAQRLLASGFGPWDLELVDRLCESGFSGTLTELIDTVHAATIDLIA